MFMLIVVSAGLAAIRAWVDAKFIQGGFYRKNEQAFRMGVSLQLLAK